MIWIVVGGFIAIQRFQPSLYYRIAFIVSYALLIIFVLSAWAWSASDASIYLSWSDSWGGWLGGSDYGNPWKGLGAALAVGAALGAIVWVLLIVSLVFFVIQSLRDGGDGVAAAPRGPDAEMGAVKVEQPAVAPQQTYEADHNQQQYQQYPPEQQQQYPPQQQQQYPPQQQPQGPYQS
jgi:hypothetical protein